MIASGRQTISRINICVVYITFQLKRNNNKQRSVVVINDTKQLDTSEWSTATASASKATPTIFKQLKLQFDRRSEIFTWSRRIKLLYSGTQCCSSLKSQKIKPNRDAVEGGYMI